MEEGPKRDEQDELVAPLKTPLYDYVRSSPHRRIQ